MSVFVWYCFQFLFAFELLALHSLVLVQSVIHVRLQGNVIWCSLLPKLFSVGVSVVALSFMQDILKGYGIRQE